MKAATWNVNSIRVRLPQVLDWLDAVQPDVLAMQETKAADDVFPAEAFTERGYQVVFAGQKTYNGVAIASRTEGADPLAQLPGIDDTDKRLLAATFDGTRFINVYVPNGSSVGSDKYAHKLRWLGALRDHVAVQLEQFPRLVVMGDFNIAPADADVHDPKAWEGEILCSDGERQALREILDTGMTDVFRAFEQEPGTFSWWDYRAAAFRRNNGLRIDLILTSAAASAASRACYVDKEPRALERPSDHTPVVVEFAS